MMFRPSFELSATISQDAKQRHFLVFKEWQYFVVQDVSRSNRMFTFIELRKSNTSISINKSLLVNAADAFDIPDVIGVLASQVSWMFSFDFTERFTTFLFPFQSH